MVKITIESTQKGEASIETIRIPCAIWPCLRIRLQQTFREGRYPRIRISVYPSKFQCVKTIPTTSTVSHRINQQFSYGLLRPLGNLSIPFLRACAY